MSNIVADFPIWGIALLIFAMRVIDVTLGTIRTIAIVHGRTLLAVILGFVELSVWFIAVSEAVARVSENPILIAAFAGGFATGNAVGIMVERRLAFGSCVVRMISGHRAHDVAKAISRLGTMVTTFAGTSDSGARSLVYTLCPRRLVALAPPRSRARNAKADSNKMSQNLNLSPKVAACVSRKFW